MSCDEGQAKESLMSKGKGSGHQIGRDASTGQFIPVSAAVRRPSTTVVETIRPPQKPKGK